MTAKNHILLIEGPNGSGKDYFIGQLEDYIGEHYPEAYVKHVTIKSILDPNIKNKLVQKDTYNFDDDISVRFTKDHMLFLDYIETHLVPDTETFLLVNRWLPSLYVYQTKMSENPLNMAHWDQIKRSYGQRLHELAQSGQILQIYLLPDEQVIVERLSKDNRVLEDGKTSRQLHYYRDYIENHSYKDIGPILVFDSQTPFEDIFKN